jgi:hypothetical protein
MIHDFWRFERVPKSRITNEESSHDNQRSGCSHHPSSMTEILGSSGGSECRAGRRSAIMDGSGGIIRFRRCRCRFDLKNRLESPLNMNLPRSGLYQQSVVGQLAAFC